MIINDAGLTFTLDPDKRKSTTMLILHHAAGNGSVEAIHKAHLARNWYGIGYHYYIRKDGSIWRGRPEDSVGTHTVGKNTVSVAVCFEGNFETDVMPEAQLESGRQLIADILGRYQGIKVSTHRDHDSTACPGKNFPQELIDLKVTDDCAAFIAQLTDAQAYAMFEKAQRHAATLPLPEWAREEYSAAVAAGITDGENPMMPLPRYQAALMALRGK